MSHVETLPQSWDAVRDVDFFRITTRIFDAAFVAGASVLLGSYDDEPLLESPVPVAPPVTVAAPVASARGAISS